MKAFVSGVLACCVISVGAWIVLTQQLDYSAETLKTSPNDTVRLD
ncbi:hypothetical protein JM93_01754 [Roseibium hamelinense]|uniref:Uncharacterized protein n=1 Tax=Roseibium hamelinense TaxID=150831 RepID=A0A562T7G6_9HYPH|nr:hypothetical protein [Roseibium hamelinense]TWI89551.1 hypothetical protein JM93_01754 [Roseibium hamelinense]